MVKNLLADAWYSVSIRVKKLPGEGNGNPLQNSCLENPMDRGAWHTTVCSLRRVRHGLATQFSSVTQRCPTLCDPMNCSMPGLPVHHQLLEFTQTHVHWVGDAIQPSHLCRPRLLLPPIPPSIRVFSNESVLHMKWPNYWSFSLSIIPPKEQPGLISFRMDWLDLLTYLC